MQIILKAFLIRPKGDFYNYNHHMGEEILSLKYALYQKFTLYKSTKICCNKDKLKCWKSQKYKRENREEMITKLRKCYKSVKSRTMTK